MLVFSVSDPRLQVPPQPELFSCGREQEQEGWWKFLMPLNVVYVTSVYILLAEASHVAKTEVRGTGKYAPSKGGAESEQQYHPAECGRHISGFACPTPSSWSFRLVLHFSGCQVTGKSSCLDQNPGNHPGLFDVFYIHCYPIPSP